MEPHSFRPRSVSELIDTTIRIARAHFGVFAVIAVMAYIPMVAIGVAMLPITSNPDAPPAGAALVVFVIVYVFGILWYLMADGMLVHAAAEAYLARTPSAAGSLRAAGARAVPLVIGNLLRGFLIAAPFLVVLLGAFLIGSMFGSTAGGVVGGLAGLASLAFGMYAYFRLLTVPAVIMFEDRGPVAAISRSWALGQGQAWRAFKAFLLAYLIIGAGAGVVMIALSLIVRNPLVVGSLAYLAFALTYPILPTAVALLYYDLRIRKEAYDIELMAQALPQATARGATV